MPTADMQRVSSHTFPGPEVKRTGSWTGPAYSSVHLLHSQGTHGSSKGRSFQGSNIKSDSKACETSPKSDNQENIIFKPSASVPKYALSGFGQHSAQYESLTAADAFKNVQSSSRLASTSSQSGSTLMRTLQVPEPNPLSPSRGESSNEVARTSGFGKFFPVKPPKNPFGHMEFNSEVTRDPNLGSTFISSPISHLRSSSKGSQSINNVQTASSSYDLLLKDTSMYSSTNPRKPSNSGLKYTEVKSSVVSSGPVFVVQGGGSVQGHGGYTGHPDSVKSLGGPSHADAYQGSQSSGDTRLTASSPGKSWNEPHHYSMSGTPYSSSPELRKPSKNDCRGSVAKSSIISSGGILFKAPESALRKKFTSPQYEATRPKFQQAYNVHGQPSQIYKPMNPSRSWEQHYVAKSSTASSGPILIMEGPTNVLSRTESNKLVVHPGFPEDSLTFASGQSAHQNQPVDAGKNSRNVQPATSTYASSSQTGFQTFSSVKGTSYKPNFRPSKPLRSELRFSSSNPTIAGANKINTVFVRLNKPSTSSFRNLQNQWASGDVSSGAFQNPLPPSYPCKRPGQSVQTPVSTSATQYHGSKAVQSQFTMTQGNADYIRHITAVPSEFSQGAIQRLSPTLSSNYRQGLL